MRCGFWEFVALVQHEKQRHDTGLIGHPESRRAFHLPAFLTGGTSAAMGQPAHRAALLNAGERSAREKCWINSGNRLNNQWYEVVTTLAHGPVCAFLHHTEPDGADVRAVVAMRHGLSFRVLRRDDEVQVDEVPGEVPWLALVDCLPDSPVPRGAPITLPTRLFAAATEAQHVPEGGTAHILRTEGIREHDAVIAREWMRPVEDFSAEISVGVRDHDSTLHIGQFPLRLQHCADGRIATYPVPPMGETSMLAPGDPARLVETIQLFIDDAWRRLSQQGVRRLAEHPGPLAG